MSSLFASVLRRLFSFFVLLWKEGGRAWLILVQVEPVQEMSCHDVPPEDLGRFREGMMGSNNRKFAKTRPKPAYGRQGLEWIVGPGYSFVVFSTNRGPQLTSSD